MREKEKRTIDIIRSLSGAFLSLRDRVKAAAAAAQEESFSERRRGEEILSKPPSLSSLSFLFFLLSSFLFSFFLSFFLLFLSSFFLSFFLFLSFFPFYFSLSDSFFSRFRSFLTLSYFLNRFLSGWKSLFEFFERKRKNHFFPGLFSFFFFRKLKDFSFQLTFFPFSPKGMRQQTKKKMIVTQGFLLTVDALLTILFLT